MKSAHLARGGFLRAYFYLAAVVYVLVGCLASAWLAPRVPYADAWRHYARLLTQPFPASVLAVDNGHPEIFANLVRLADLTWFAGTEYAQIAVALLLALATFAVLLRLLLLSAPQREPVARAAAASQCLVRSARCCSCSVPQVRPSRSRLRHC